MEATSRGRSPSASHTRAVAVIYDLRTAGTCANASSPTTARSTT